MNPKIDSALSAGIRKPRVSLFFATAGYVGYIPKAPGTWGSAIGVVAFWELVRWWNRSALEPLFRLARPEFVATFESNSLLRSSLLLSAPITFCVLIAFLGVAAAHHTADYARAKDPQFVVIDEVSGVVLTLLLGLAISFYPASATHNPDFLGYAVLFYFRMLNWKYLGLGFILFRVFDIWKPFPVRQAESLPGGWGIMADDWIAAVYAAIGIWLARAFGL